ncbi:unnamed protein product [Durusdinium trenchii]|uniref:EF-hand domain-containing protein n=1 Tax=Durusdinium trenchii TaxID=1381693 RepID=A0ABP0KR21_9DINO
MLTAWRRLHVWALSSVLVDAKYGPADGTFHTKPGLSTGLFDRRFEEPLVEDEKRRHLVKSKEFSLDDGSFTPGEVEVVLFDVYSLDSFVACCAARAALTQHAQFEGVTILADENAVRGSGRGPVEKVKMLSEGDRLREEHELQINSLSTTIVELTKKLRKETGTKNVQIFEHAEQNNYFDEENGPSKGVAGSQCLGCDGERDNLSDPESWQMNTMNVKVSDVAAMLLGVFLRFAHLGILQSNAHWYGEQHESWYMKFRRFVQSALFETTFAGLIVFNALVMAADVQRAGVDIGASLGYADYQRVETSLPWAESAFTVLEYIFGVAFTMEILLKILALGLSFAKDLWNWFDTFLVACWYVDTVGQDLLPVNTTLLRLLRLMRFTRSMLSMFEITLGNWPPVCRRLSEKVSEWFMLLCILHKLVIGFAVVGVINGVFIQETFKVASSDNQIMMRQKERSSNLHEMKMRQLFLEADNDGDGFVSAEEWRELVSHPAVQLWLGSMDLDAADADGLYKLIHDLDQDGDLTMDELIRGVARLKGAARSYDLQMLLRQVSALTDSVDNLNKRLVSKSRGSLETMGQDSSIPQRLSFLMLSAFLAYVVALVSRTHRAAHVQSDRAALAFVSTVRQGHDDGMSRQDSENINDTGGEGQLAHLMKGAAWIDSSVERSPRDFMLHMSSQHSRM